MPRFLAFAFCSDPYRDPRDVINPACLSSGLGKFKFFSSEKRSCKIVHMFDFSSYSTFCSGWH